jgi:hypothetical protein
VTNPWLQLNAIQARQRDLEAQASNDRLARQIRQAQPRTHENVFVGLGDFLIACGLRLKGEHGTPGTAGPGATALALAGLPHSIHAFPEMALRIWQVEGGMAYSLTYTRQNAAALPQPMRAPGTYYSLTWLAQPRDVSTAGACR